MFAISLRRLKVIALLFLLPQLGLAKTELMIWEQEKAEDQKILDQVIDRFQASHKDIKIKRAHYKTEDLRTQFQIAALGRGGADLVLAPNDFAGPFSIMGLIQPVDSWLDKSKFDPAVLKAIQEQDKTWGIPVSSGNHLILFINKSLVPKAPETVEELIKTAKALTSPSEHKYGLAYHLTEPFWFVSFLGAYGEVPLKNRKPNLDTVGMRSALELAKSLKFDEGIVPKDCDYVCAETLFLEEKAAMLINGDWAVEKYLSELKDNLVIRPLPKLAKTGQYMAPFTSGKYLLLNNKLSGKDLEAAKEFAKFMVSEEIQEVYLTKSKRLPAIKSLRSEDRMAKYADVYQSLKAMDHGLPMPMAVEMRAVWDAMRPQLQLVMSGKTDVKQAAKVMQEDALSKISEMGQ